MKTAVIFDTSIASNNMGDEIIVRSAEANLKKLLGNYYKLRYPTHTKAFTAISSRTWEKANLVKNADIKLVIGTDLLWKNMLHPLCLWNINIFNCSPLAGTVACGCGCAFENIKNINLYTKMLYSKVLSHDYVHSTRDEETKVFLEQLGYKAIVTGCPTLWNLDEEFCSTIPANKSDSVIFTLSGTGKDHINDQKFINIIRRNYKKVYFWPQTIFDLDYLNGFENIRGINIVSGDLNVYSDFLANHDVDYVGTRLHGGIFAMHHRKRAIIIAIDHRARNIKLNNNINCVERKKIDKVESMINSEFGTNIILEREKIDKWINQFGGGGVLCNSNIL